MEITKKIDTQIKYPSTQKYSANIPTKLTREHTNKVDPHEHTNKVKILLSFKQNYE